MGSVLRSDPVNGISTLFQQAGFSGLKIQFQNLLSLTEAQSEKQHRKRDISGQNQNRHDKMEV